VLLDNARDAAQVAPLLPAAPGCAVVVTSRDHLAGLVAANGARPVALDLLEPDEARALLAARLGTDRLAAEPDAAEDIVRACAGLPLALAIVAARAAIRPAHPLGGLAVELRDALGALNRAVDVRAIFSHYNRDIVYAVQGREADALAAACRAHELFDRLGDDVGQAIALTDMGWHHGRLGNHGPALDLLEQALVLHQKLGNRAFEAHALSCLADIRLRVGDRAGAIPRYRRSLDQFRALGDRYAEASLLAHIGACHHLNGDHTAAGDEWRHAGVLLDELDPSTVDQIHTQLTLVDGSVADAFRQRVTSRSG
jgi:tetratricopeptide (TPR) repeat protein